MELHPLSTTEEQFNQYMSELHPLQYNQPFVQQAANIKSNFKK